MIGTLLAVAVALDGLEEEEVLLAGFIEDEDDGAVVVTFAGFTEEDMVDVFVVMMRDDALAVTFVVYLDGQRATFRWLNA